MLYTKRKYYLFISLNMGQKLLIAVVIFLVLLISVVGSSVAYQKYFLTPERIIKKARTNLAEKQSWEYSGDLKMSSLTFRFSGASEQGEGEKSDKKSWFLVNMRMGATVSNSMEFRLIEGSLYAKFGPSTNTFIGKTTPAEAWIKVDEATVAARAEQTKKAGDTSPAWWYSGFASSEAKEQLFAKQRVLDNINPFETLEVLQNTRINGLESYH